MSTLCMTLPLFVILCASMIPSSKFESKGQFVANWLALLVGATTRSADMFPCLAAIKQEEEAGYVSLA